MVLQDLVQEVKDLKNKVKDLENEVKDLKTQIKSLGATQEGQEGILMAWQVAHLVFHGA